jgi:short subunit dehydrogenase-like uncharacterized protein
MNVRHEAHIFDRSQDSGAPAPVVVGRVAFKADAGYMETAKLLTEAGICMALDSKKIPMSSGFLTPVAALGETYLERLLSAGIEFAIEKPKAQ